MIVELVKQDEQDEQDESFCHMRDMCLFGLPLFCVNTVGDRRGKVRRGVIAVDIASGSVRDSKYICFVGSGMLRGILALYTFIDFLIAYSIVERSFLSSLPIHILQHIPDFFCWKSALYFFHFLSFASTSQDGDHDHDTTRTSASPT